MAVTLADVRDKIEDNAIEHGWDDAAIQARIDAGQSANRIAAIYWTKRAQQTLYLVNVSEGGSTRGLDSIYPRLVAMAKLYSDLADAEDGDDPGDAAARYIRSHPIKRV
jgi:hypothetical protein